MPAGGGDPIPLLESKILVGRSRSAQIRIKQGSVSGRHCVLTWEDGYWFVEDLNSSNGVRVNNERVDHKILMPGDVLSVASHRYNIEYEAEGEPPRDHSVLSKSLLEKAGLQDIVASESSPGWIAAHEDEPELPRKYNLDDDDP